MTSTERVQTPDGILAAKRSIASLINQAKVDLQEDEGQKNDQPLTCSITIFLSAIFLFPSDREITQPSTRAFSRSTLCAFCCDIPLTLGDVNRASSNIQRHPRREVKHRFIDHSSKGEFTGKCGTGKWSAPDMQHHHFPVSHFPVSF
ncbi:hypothetical protein [Novipirellula caenicola]|uniref:hypothetical protein n=1 Tax=Novipirellula caenicola TaxID=1536901 RepID=UPI0031EADC26